MFKPRFVLGVVLVVVLVTIAGLSGIVPKASADGCECVDYIVYKLLGGKRPSGSWDTAFSMANANYWNQVGYGRQTGALPGDVIIIGPSVPLWMTSGPRGNKLFSFYANDRNAGHIGIIERADYDGIGYGWFIRIRSANFNFRDYPTKFSDAGCPNVNVVDIYFNNNNDASFWRKK